MFGIGPVFIICGSVCDEVMLCLVVFDVLGRCIQCILLLFCRYELNQKKRTVSIMELVNAHQPKTEVELVRLLKDHVVPCSQCCTQVFNGGLPGWAQALYAAAIDARHPHSLQQCQEFIYDLFVRGPLRGRETEVAALALLRKCGWANITFQESAAHIDARYAVDIIMVRHGMPVAGVQVKPTSYKGQRREVHDRDIAKNHQWGLPVVYLYYTRTGGWENIQSVLERLLAV